MPPPFVGEPSKLLLLWLRHGHTLPVTSSDRREKVIPKTSDHPSASKYRLSVNKSLRYETIRSKFEEVMNNIDEAKAFVMSNIDQIPTTLFSLALGTDTFNAQSQRDVNRMETLRKLHQRYQIVCDQIFFSAHIELQKAETRVLTYRSLIQDFPRISSNWDEIEISMFFAVLLNSRASYDLKVKQTVRTIEEVMDRTISASQAQTRDALVRSILKEPALSAEIYLNATRIMAQFFPEIYGQIAPELKVVHETYFVNDTKTLVE